MKELSIEEKAKRYDEAIERAKKWYNAPNVNKIPTFGNRVIEEIFPELKESEDERIRKDLIIYLRSILSNKKYGDKFIESWIDWLEKQAQKPAVWSEKDKNMLKWVIGYLENKMLNTPISEERTACKNAISWLEEKLDEQEPTNKVKPKFKVGDFIVNDYCTGKVIELTNDAYLLDTGQGIPFSCEHNAHLWTIQDAKDGDVLATLNQILIFEKILPNNEGISHCHYDFGCSTPQFNFNKDDNWYFGKEAKVYPATKEQRDLLFQEMKEAGYEWDAEKKELKKIEQKPVEWTMDNIKELTEFENAMMHIGGSFFGEHQGLDPNDTFVVKEQAKILLEMATKQEWSEADERMLKSIIALCDEKMKSTLYQNVIDHAIDAKNWLNSLKDRVQPQPKQEWSEEDEEHIKSLLERLEGMCKKGATFVRTGFAVSEDEDWLKHLKDRVLQPKQEWSEEDDRMCKAIINNIKAICKEGYFVGNIDSGELINWFKDLRYRLQWKPSDEQMDALLVKIPIENSCNKVDNILKSLYSDLKKLK